MHPKASPAASRAVRAPILQISLLAAVVLLALGWSWQRPALLQPAPAQQGAYITDLVLPLDVGTMEQQVGGQGRRPHPITPAPPAGAVAPPIPTLHAQMRGEAATALGGAAGA